jgi:small conductance mechanosensitive channel
MDPTVAAFLSSLAYYAVLIVVFVVILQIVGIQATSLVAVLGAASLAIGLALQGTLSNMAAGVMLLIFRPFHIGTASKLSARTVL